MRAAVFGTGSVGRTLAARMAALGHSVVVGTRDVRTLMERSGDGQSFSSWAEQHPGISTATFRDAAADAELIINATNGAGSIDALERAGADSLAGKVLLDVANPLDFSGGMPPSLFIANTDSLGEQIQRRFPEARVVKALNTMNAQVMVEPALVGGGDHSVFVSGDDSASKARVIELLQSFGWSDIIDLGDISTARGAELLLPMWLRLMGALGTPMLQFKIVR